jgi:outer membrane receptor protein involved in Fe transport
MSPPTTFGYAPSFGNQPARYYYPGEPRNFYLGLRYQW